MYKRLLLFVLAFCCASSHPASAGQIVGSGCSVSNYGYLSELAKEYERRTGVNVLVRGGGTVLGIEDLRTGKADFAAACRGRAKDDPSNIQFIQVAWDALAFIVHKTNALSSISLDNVKAIYAGKITNWKQLGGTDSPIKVFVSKSRTGLSGVEASLLSMVLNGTEPAPSPNILDLSSTGIVEQMVEKTPESFATAGYSSARKRDVKMLRVNGVVPSYRNIVSKAYGLARPLYIIIPKQPRPEVRQFIDFVLGKEGQDFICLQGVVSLRNMK